MTNQDDVDRALEAFEDMYREQVYVSREANQVILEFGRYEFIVDLWTGSRWLNDTRTGEEIMAEMRTY